ncbi:hypothetical protein GQ44DRAFT_776629 [Phaeosphaeriaceae sp. PMI808]|nr:hypothetical protein GQ44DRAFT_776629 [Phaeosphaeriaceae sp. PMI808]
MAGRVLDSVREEEGILLREATKKGVVNIARYFHHETVQIDGQDDDIRSNVRRRLDITRATNYKPEKQMPSLSTSGHRVPCGDGSSSLAGRKRSSAASAHHSHLVNVTTRAPQ